MSIHGTCKKCGGETVGYRCLNCTEEERDEAREKIKEILAVVKLSHESEQKCVCVGGCLLEQYKEFL